MPESPSESDGFLNRLPPAAVAALSLVATAVIGLLDHRTGFELSFSIFYLAPVALAAWFGGRGLGAFLSLLAAGTWLLVDLTAGHPYAHPLIPAWNGLVRFSFFAITALLLASLREHLEKESTMARTDALTGVFNARAFREETQRLLALAARHGRPVALGYLDLDDFKKVNDTLGHAEGDRVLKAFGALLVSLLRATDTVGRLGGDEFAVLLPDTDVQGARIALEQIRQRLGREATQRGWPVRLSIGAAVLLPGVWSAEEAIKRADDLMYTVKHGGKDGLRIVETAPAAGEVPRRRPEEQDRKS